MTYVLGLDAGGTYTDAVIYNSSKNKVVASGKSLTTNNNLAIGLDKSLKKALLDTKKNIKTKISLVVLSSTLATNSVVNSTGGKVCLILIGFDKSILLNSDLIKAVSNGRIILIEGGHKADGSVNAPLDISELDKLIKNGFDEGESIAITSQFSVRNPNHELVARKYIRSKLSIPITCSHELTSNLNGPKRALTCLLNAGLTSIIDQLLSDLETMLKENELTCKLMVVKGDGSLINTNTARLKPVETIMSGPAASSVGAVWLSGIDDAIIVDIGGTTTDISLIRSGAPSISTEGSIIGGWKTMVESLSINTLGLGGDSEILVSNDKHNNIIKLGSRRIIPLSILATEKLEIIGYLKEQSKFSIVADTDGKFVWLKNNRPPPKWMSKLEVRIWEKLNFNKPLPISLICPNQSSLGALNRLINYNFVSIAGLTPTDAVHVLSIFEDFNSEAAKLGATIFAKQKTLSGEIISLNHTTLSKTIIQNLILQSADAILDFSLKQDYNNLDSMRLGKNPILKNILNGNKGKIAKISIDLGLPIVSLGASAKTYYPKVASKLNTKCIIPKYFSVAGAVGAAIGSVKQRVKILITKTEEEIFKLHGPFPLISFNNINAAIKKAESLAKIIAHEKCSAAGANEIDIDLKRIDNVISLGNNKILFIEATIIATATGNTIKC